MGTKSNDAWRDRIDRLRADIAKELGRPLTSEEFYKVADELGKQNVAVARVNARANGDKSHWPDTNKYGGDPATVDAAARASFVEKAREKDRKKEEKAKAKATGKQASNAGQTAYDEAIRQGKTVAQANEAKAAASKKVTSDTAASDPAMAGKNFDQLVQQFGIAQTKKYMDKNPKMKEGLSAEQKSLLTAAEAPEFNLTDSGSGGEKAGFFGAPWAKKSDGTVDDTQTIIQQVSGRAPRYSSGDEFVDAVKPPTQIALLQVKLAKAGLLNPNSITAGRYGANEAEAMAEVLAFANQQGLDRDQALSSLVALGEKNPLLKKSLNARKNADGSVKAPLSVRLTNTEDIRNVAEVTAVTQLGRKFTAAELDAFQATYHAQERGAQTAAYNDAGSYQNAPTLESGVQSFARNNNPGEYLATQAANSFGDFLDIIGVQH